MLLDEMGGQQLLQPGRKPEHNMSQQAFNNKWTRKQIVGGKHTQSTGNITH